jgi:hypothetical protein
MTRPLLALLVGTLLLGSGAAFAPGPIAEAAIVRHEIRTPIADPPAFDLHLGDGIFRLRVRSCQLCETSITLEIRFTEPGFLR